MQILPVPTASLLLLTAIVTGCAATPSVAATTLIPTCFQDPETQPFPPEWEQRSFLYQPSFSMNYELCGPAVPYCPQPGDLFLATDKGLLAKLGHKAAFTGAPQHSGIVIALPNGRVGLLEGGPHNTLHCRILDVILELQSYAAQERVWIRKRRVPLTPEQSNRLTAFAQAAEGKRFAVIRLFGQLTPLRSRGPLRTEHRGCPRGDRASYFCSELVTESCVAAGLLDPQTARPAATYPRDLFFGQSRNPYLDCHLDLSAWDPPARWTLCPGKESALPRRFPRLDGDTEDR
jgi:hypothetical protein